MKKILFVNIRAKNCGVHDYGVRLYNIIKKSSNFHILFVDIENLHNLINIFNIYQPDVVLYNYIIHIYPFLNDDTIRTIRHVPQLIIYHEGAVAFNCDGVLSIDSTMDDNPDKNFYSLPRPLFEHIDVDEISNETPVIGSFGFGFTDKNFPKIAEVVCSEFETAKIRLNIPFAQFGDEQGNIAKNEIEKIKKIIYNSNKNIELEYSHDFLEHDDMLNFLKHNDVNVFLYEKHATRGLSSAIDYSLSAKKPIAINDSYMFRHINKTEPSIILNETNDLKTIIKNGIEPLKPFYEKYSQFNLINKFEYAINSIINKI